MGTRASVVVSLILVFVFATCGDSPQNTPTPPAPDPTPSLPLERDDQTPTPSATAISSPTGTGVAPGDSVARELEIGLAVSQRQRAASPNVSSSDLAKLVSGNSAFAFELYEALSGEDGNFFYSPYSISVALAMAYAGARGETESQMADTLHFLLSQERLHPAVNSLDLELATRGEGAEGTDEKGFRLNIVNAVWGQRGYGFLPGFLDVLAENYGAGLRLLDFIEAPEESRLAINDWVSEQTEDRIEELIPPEVIDGSTRLVLTNAVYFNAAWALPFREDATADGSFHLVDGGETTVPMMKGIAHYRYAEGDRYQAVELLYEGRELSMVILIPDAGQFGAFEDTLSGDLVDTIANDLERRQFILSCTSSKQVGQNGSL